MTELRPSRQSMQCNDHDHFSESGPASRGQLSAVEKCPLLNVSSASEYGVVMESKRDFETGSTLTIGFHVNRRKRASSGRRGSSFISAEMIVVESHPEVASDGRLVFRITLLFTDVSARDRKRIVRASERGQSIAPKSDPAFSLN